MKRIRNMILAWAAVVIGVLVLFTGSVFAVRAVGKNRLVSETKGAMPKLLLGDSEPQDEDVVWKEGWVRYNGKVYEYNDQIMTFLFMGIDKEGEVEDNPNAYSGGQSDSLILIVADRSTKEVRLIAINRDTMTDVDMYNLAGEGESSYVTAQIATQHGFGDGREISCELTKEAVSRLFFDLPIHGYVAINMESIAQLNDAVGGVEVTVLEDLTKINPDWEEGTRHTLMGEDAFWYVKWRDITIHESNLGRLARQKQYVTGYIDQAKIAVKKDITLPLTLYKSLEPYMVTDITLDEIAYLAGELLDYTFDGEIYTLQGETIMGEKHEEFYPDMEALQELMLNVFYVEVDMDAQ
ncbi:MAG: LCP family protein [Lachnospiraceae bacterium]|nr:LCP family protein [Lachnospiraceae bacterium]